MRDLHELPKVRDSWSFLYVEHAKIDQEDKAIAVQDATGTTPVPCASLMTLLLGPGTSVTHAAIKTLADSGCTVAWVGEGAVRFYAQGMAETRSARNLLRQVEQWSSPRERYAVVMRMYHHRFAEPLDPGLSLPQVRGLEGIRVREAYARASRETGVPWNGRTYDRGDWMSADPVNRALSSANACLYAVCQSAIVSAGYSPALGFIHTGKMLAFVYDVADLYKVDVTVPLAFRAAASGTADLERRVRKACREAFHQHRLLRRVVDDVEHVLFGTARRSEVEAPEDADAALPGALWDAADGEVSGGHNYADEGPTR